MTAPLCRTATGAEIAMMLDWAAGEGWNPGLADAEAFHAADPDGFFVAEVAGAPVATISVVNHSESMAFLGLYICRPECRGQGIGFALWRHALAHAGERTVGLDGVAAQQANYARSGFALEGATTRYEGRLPGASHSAIREATPGDAGVIAGLDRVANGYERLAFLARWTAPDAMRRTFILPRDGAPIGYATARRCRDGVKIGPIVSPGAEAALDLARAAMAYFPSDRTIVDLPAGSTALASSLREFDFQPTFATARMYRGAAPATGADLQAIATMELG